MGITPHAIINIQAKKIIQKNLLFSGSVTVCCLPVLFKKPVIFTCPNYCNLIGSNLDRIMPSQIKIKPRTRLHVEMKSESKSLGTKLKP